MAVTSGEHSQERLRYQDTNISTIGKAYRIRLVLQLN